MRGNKVLLFYRKRPTLAISVGGTVSLWELILASNTMHGYDHVLRFPKVVVYESVNRMHCIHHIIMHDLAMF